MPLIETTGAASSRGLGQFAWTAVATYIEDVFSTWLYTGNGSTQTITNGIDLAGKGGLVWTKSRSDATDNGLTDTTRGAGTAGNGTSNILVTNAALSEGTSSGGATPRNNLDYVSAFNSNGFSVGAGGGTDVAKQMTNANTATYVSWTFRKQAKFFDIVTYTGNGANRTISHSLGSVPGCIIIKRRDTGADGQVYHRSLANTEYMVLNTTAAKATGATRWNSTTPTATEFSLGADASVNANGGTYVAYLFAHDAGGFGASGTDNVISCGSFTTDSSGVPPNVNLGWEPQWILTKNVTSVGPWRIQDNMRGATANGGVQYLSPNTSGTEASDISQLAINATGFGGGTGFGVTQTFIYIAIRRGPMRTPTTGTSVFTPLAMTPSTGTVRSVNFPADLLIGKTTSFVAGAWWTDRLRGFSIASTTNSLGLISSGTNAEQNQAPVEYNVWNNVATDGGYFNTLAIAKYRFCRAPGFFDVVCYTGTGANRTVAHNLGVAPELWIVKGRSGATAWAAGSTALANTEYLVLNTTAAKVTGATYWNSTFPTASNLSLGAAGDVNTSAATYVAYLFATVAGVSKVFSYTGNGSSQTINCGFTAGARFVLIKRTDSTGDWYVWDSARGIVASNDPHLSLNTAAAEVTTDDSVDTDNTGFVVNQVAATNVNVSSATYIGLAIA